MCNAFVNKILLNWLLNHYYCAFPALEKLSNTGNDRTRNFTCGEKNLAEVFVAVGLN